MKIINIYLIFINTVAALLMYIDKTNSIKKKRRISEHTLIELSVLGASPAILLAMIILKHKIRKPKFTILVPIFLILLIIMYNNITK